MKLYITGVSGTGKTSIAEALSARGINTADIDDISHWENKHTGQEVELEPGGSDEWWQSHAWICDVSKLKEILSRSEDVVVVGNASNQDEYLSLFDKIFILTSSPETIISRIESRTNNDFGKHPSDQVRILNWQKSYEPEMVGKGAVVLDGERPLEEVVQEVLPYLK